MCGIVGYIGSKPADKILLNGLKRLEYRGYDSAGIALLKDKEISVQKNSGKVSELEKKLKANSSTTGIGHTRWATHGAPTFANAHPHSVGGVCVVHNGIIENYQELKTELLSKGVVFKSETDTEVLAALISIYTKALPLQQAITKTLKRVVGTFGLAVVAENGPEAIFVARRGSPVLIGISDSAHYVASDAAALVPYTDRVVYLEDDQLAKVEAESFEVFDLENNFANLEEHQLPQNSAHIEKAGFDHFLIKEIFEQPKVLQDCMRGRLQPDGTVKLQGLDMVEDRLRSIEQIVIVGCGTAYYSGLMGKYLLERLTGIPVSGEYGSEFRYRDAAIKPQTTLALFMSQSGETADTLASLEKMKRLGVLSLGLVNVVGSTLAREVDGGIYLHAGPEISVASTKAYSTMVVSLLLVGLHLARLHGLDRQRSKSIAKALLELPKEIEDVLAGAEDIELVAKKIQKFDQAFYLGRENLYPAALEGSLKLMEVSYIQAQAYPTGEMKHGPIALIEPSFLSVVLLPEEELLYKKTLSNIEEIKARQGTVLTVSSRPPVKLADYSITLPKVPHWIEPLVANVALQLLAYYVAVARGTDVDQPRNLAKSVTVE